MKKKKYKYICYFYYLLTIKTVMRAIMPLRIMLIFGDMMYKAAAFYLSTLFF